MPNMPDIFISTAGRSKEKLSNAPKFAELPGPDKSVEGMPGHTHNPLAAYCLYPHRLGFVNKDPEEKIILLLRSHFITNIPWIIIGILLIIAPRVLMSFPILDFLPARFQFVAILIWYLVTTAFIFEKFLSWFFHVFIITDERIIDVDFINLVYREMSDANIDKIQDVTVVMGSVIRSIFNYGDIVIQTAAEIPQIEFEAVPFPDKVARVLRELRIEEEQEHIEGRVR